MWTRAAVGATLLAVAITACSEPAADRRDDGTIVVASFDFAESAVLAELYAGALRSAGFDADVAPRVGTRETVLPALELGLVDVVPEYAGSAIGFLGGSAPERPRAANAALRGLLAARGIETLPPSPAQSRNALVVTTATAVELGLESIADLRTVAPEMTLGGPPDCPQRDTCVRGFASAYDVRFGEFLPLDFGGPITAEAVRRGTVDVGVLFTSDGSLATHDLVLLRDDRRLQPPENITPLVARSLADREDGVVEVLDRVSQQLTTADLRALNAEVSTGSSPHAVALEWLDGHGFPIARG
jgi:osmoprotectant transport system substrate-binding protein